MHSEHSLRAIISQSKQQYSVWLPAWHVYTCTRPLPGLDHLVHLLLQFQPLAPFSVQLLSQRIHVGLFSQLPQLFLYATTQNTEQHLQRPFADTSKGVGFFLPRDVFVINRRREIEEHMNTGCSWYWSDRNVYLPGHLWHLPQFQKEEQIQTELQRFSRRLFPFAWIKHSWQQLINQQQLLRPSSPDSHGFAANCSASIILSAFFFFVISVTRLFPRSPLRWLILLASVYMPPIVGLYHLWMRKRQREPVCARREKGKLSKGCYRLSSLNTG